MFYDMCHNLARVQEHTNISWDCEMFSVLSPSGLVHGHGLTYCLWKKLFTIYFLGKNHFSLGKI